MTSGYNVGENIYLTDAFNDLCGFTEAEIAAKLQTYKGWRAAPGWFVISQITPPVLRRGRAGA